MLEGLRALELALSLARLPTLATTFRTQPLPPDVLVVIRIAAGCEETASEAALATGIPVARIREAAVFYLKMILLRPESDSHRVLGVLPDASRGQMREHMRWLVRWLHPDLNANRWESAHARRVIAAWRELERGHRKPGAIAKRQSSLQPRKLAGRPVQRWIELPLKQRMQKSHRVAAVVFALALVISAVSAVTLMSADTPILERLARLGSIAAASE